jgi:hypothetical protein
VERNEVLDVVDSIINAATNDIITEEHLEKMQKISDEMMSGKFDDFDQEFFKKLQTVRIPLIVQGLIR